VAYPLGVLAGAQAWFYLLLRRSVDLVGLDALAGAQPEPTDPLAQLAPEKVEPSADSESKSKQPTQDESSQSGGQAESEA
jgi:hypothetical protein